MEAMYSTAADDVARVADDDWDAEPIAVPNSVLNSDGTRTPRTRTEDVVEGGAGARR